MSQLSLFNDRQAATVATTPDIDDALSRGSPVALGVSGGKDSCAMGFAVDEYLDSIGHSGERILIHSDLGKVEWKDSLPTCERLSDALGYPLMVVQRKAGGMMERWQGRWAANVARYENLECVKLILPWSTPSMRFCTSELKTAVICSNLKKKFGSRSKNAEDGVTIINGIGIRGEESKKRAEKPISRRNNLLKRKTDHTEGFDWNPIRDWMLPDVWAICERRGFRMHEAYKVFKSSRVSCSFCMLATLSDHEAAGRDEHNHDVYREMVDLEIVSTFSFQSNRWLGDANPHVLTSEQRRDLGIAKYLAKQREAAEAKISEDLCYVKGWPTFVPSDSQCELIASVRRDVNRICELQCKYLTGPEVKARYSELMEIKDGLGDELS